MTRVGSQRHRKKIHQVMATGWTIRESNLNGGEIFRTCPDRPWGPPSFLYNGYRVFPRGKERLRRDADPSAPSSAVGHERVELYLYSPYGPYGMYRVSVPVQRCTLPFLHQIYVLVFTTSLFRTLQEIKFLVLS